MNITILVGSYALVKFIDVIVYLIIGITLTFLYYSLRLIHFTLYLYYKKFIKFKKLRE